MPPLEELVRNWGYLAILGGTFLEGETVLVMGGFAAHRGYLGLAGVMAAAFVGSMAGDQLLYILGRFRGERILARFPRLRPRLEPIARRIERYQDLLILSFRFTYGIRTITPFALGLLARVSPRRFLLPNGVSALAWAVTFAAAGYFFGAALEAAFGSVRRVEREIMLGVALAGGALGAVHILRNRKKTR